VIAPRRQADNRPERIATPVEAEDDRGVIRRPIGDRDLDDRASDIDDAKSVTNGAVVISASRAAGQKRVGDRRQAPIGSDQRAMRDMQDIGREIVNGDRRLKVWLRPVR
jgi:hypothetical protein